VITIELRDIWYCYPGASLWALKEVSIELGSGEIMLVAGHNGSGKTTLLKIAALIYRPTRGEVSVDGWDFWMLKEEERIMVRRRITYIHEKPVLMRGSVLENIMYPLRIRGLGREDAAMKAKTIMRELELMDLADKSAKELSAGQSQLVAIARALAAEPELIFLDEPFAHLDSWKSGLVAQVLQARRRNGVGIVIASHGRGELPEGLEPDRIIMLEGGRIRGDKRLGKKD
jgi:ABC-type multidrug transport system ATPase subunit